jgi:hypothetical protein
MILNLLYPRMISASFGLYWPCSSGEEVENVKLLTDIWTDRQLAIKKAYLSFQIR